MVTAPLRAAPVAGAPPPGGWVPDPLAGAFDAPPLGPQAATRIAVASSAPPDVMIRRDLTRCFLHWARADVDAAAFLSGLGPSVWRRRERAIKPVLTTRGSFARAASSCEARLGACFAVRFRRRTAARRS